MQLQLPPRAARSRKHLIPAVILVLAMVGVAVWLYFGRVTSTDAMLNGNVALLEAPFDGRIVAVPVTDGQLVAAGTVLVQLDDSFLRGAVQEARARLDAMDSGIAGAPLSAEAVREAEQAIMAAMQKARNDEAQARREYEHQTTLHVQAQLALRRLESQVSRPPSGAERNAAKLAEIESRSAMEQAQADFESISRHRAATDNSLARFRQDVARQQQLNQNPDQRLQQRQFQAMWLARTEAALEAATLKAPWPGLVGRLHAGPGSLVRKGQLLGTLTPVSPANLWVDARLADKDAARITAGMKARVEFSESTPPLTIDGVVEQLLPATPRNEAGTGTQPGAETAPKEPQGFMARIVFAPGTVVPEGALRLGMRGRAVMFTY